jgi:diguanylate cyclase (GGDEF)-like protein/PAS domain S-box-containing protein
MQKLGFLRKNLHVLFTWPVICGLLGFVMWSVVLSEINEEKAIAEENIYKHAAALSTAYAEQLARSIEQLDQITLNVKYYWETTGGQVRLEDQLKHGMYPASTLLFVSIMDRHGDLVTSTIAPRKPLSYANKGWFQAHKTGPSQGLVIVNQEIGFQTDQSVIRFTRRLDSEDGSFDGVVFVSVEPDYLTTFYDESRLGKTDFVTVRSTAGPLLATKVGNDDQPARVFYRTDPVFGPASGVIEEPKEKFDDDQERIIAWNKLKKYPLVTLAGLSKKDAFVTYEAIAKNHHNFAVIGSVFLFLFAMAGMLLSARLARKNQQADEVNETYRLAVDAANEGFYMIRPVYDAFDQIADFQIEDCNERGAGLVGTTKEQLVGRKISKINADDFQQEEVAKFRRAMETGFYEEEMRVSPSDPFKANWIYRRLVRSGVGLAMTVRDISETKAHEQALSMMANADALTELPNRHWLANYLPTAVSQAITGNTRLAILFIDLDDFKNINDTLGHAAGDELLRTAAKRLSSLIRASDHVVRLGGDEFTVVLEHVRHVEDVSRVARNIIKSIARFYPEPVRWR